MMNLQKIEQIKTGKIAGFGDIVFFLSLSLLIFIGLFLLFRPAPAAELRMVVQTGGTEYASYLLTEDREIDVDGKLTVVIENGAAYVKDPHCPDKICAAFGKIRRPGELIVCVPEGITVRIIGDSEIRGEAR